MAETHSNSQNDTDQYKQATQEVVDDAMRTDVLGPNICKVLREHNPTSKELKSIILNLIDSDADVRSALTKQADDRSLTNKGKGLTQMQAIALTAFLTLLVTIAGTAAFNYFTGNSQKSPDKTTSAKE